MDPVLFWDFDGTLSYPNKSFDTALSYALQRSGHKVSAEATAQFFNTLYTWKTPQVTYPHRTCGLWWEMTFEKICDFLRAQQIPSADHGAICADFKEILTDVSNYQLYPDTVQTLSACVAMGYRNYLVTNNYPEITDNLKALGLSGFFSGYIVSSHIGYEKPQQAFFDYAKALAGNPEVAFMIGDNPVADIAGGNEAGFVTIAVHACTDSPAKHYCENLLSLLPLLEEEASLLTAGEHSSHLRSQGS